jgi:RNA polymerase sigma factor (sigma-70 family)
MRYELATDDQLWTIIKHDYKNCPPSLLRGAVLELLNRNLFDRLIRGVIQKTVRYKYTEKRCGIGLEDLLQIGRLKIYKVIDQFNPNRAKSNSLTSFLYLAIKSEFQKVLITARTEKRDNSKEVSYQNKMEDDDDYEIFLRDKVTNVEKYVINKVTLEQLLSRVNNHRRNVVYYRLQGYTFEEIAEILGRGSKKTMHQAYKLAIEAMRKGA